MEKKRWMKLRISSGIAKRIDFPKDFNELIEKAKTFVPLGETQKFQFIDENINREIRHQEDYELFSNHVSEKPIKILIKIVEKEKDENKIFPEVFQDTFISENVNVSIIPNLGNPEDDSKDKLEKDIKKMVKDKIKAFEENLVEDIYQSIKTKMEVEVNVDNNNNNNNNEIIHDGIKCNECNIENIKGARYLCTKCQNYNLCSNCEKNTAHDPSHILIKIRKTLKEETELNELTSKINKELKYKNYEYNYSVEPKNIEFKISNKEMDILVQQVTLKNTGQIPWEDAMFKCLPHSQIRGKSVHIKDQLKKDETINIEIIFENFKDKLIPSVNEYYANYQMFNNKKEAFGNITRFKVVFTE
jgi:hypothetical protein